MQTSVSVILCTHNPRPDYLDRVLASLRGQTLPAEQWEFLLVDNASKQPLAETWDISWHSCGRHVREEELGLTGARHAPLASQLRRSKGLSLTIKKEFFEKSVLNLGFVIKVNSKQHSSISI